MKKSLIIFLLAVFPSLGGCDVLLPTATISVTVVAEDGAPISGALVGVGFELPYEVNQPYRATTKEAVTGPSGEVSFTEKTAGRVSFGASKDGYYRTFGEGINFTSQILERKPLEEKRTVVLRQIGKPIPMYIRKARLEVPVVDEPIGFDLEASDWVAPHGKGTVKDFIFTLSRKWVDKKNFDVRLVLSFSNPGDGIQNIEIPKNYGSELKLPRTAPEEGYQAQLSTSISRLPGKKIQNQANDSQNHIYRVRTVLDDKGQIQSALYGKIHGDFRLDPIRSKTGVVAFTYYLNPTSLDRNLESDPTRNLFTILEPSEKVNEP